MNKLILDLCGGSGSWSEPYRKAGYYVDTIDLPRDVRFIEYDKTPIHGILAAPPCTYFCTMRQCRGAPTKEQLQDALSIVDACLRLIAIHRPQWWALENPEGSLKKWLGPPALKFQPYEYGDAWTKKTLIWGHFNAPMPMFSSVRSVQPKGQWVDSGKWTAFQTNRKLRSVTPPGFAQAFFEANP